ncbi:MAG TPA: hypothetical protein VJ728_03700, partial [Candidatus Binataceae bacterium]|nr:hypothetical protein [Candidatus Binataceae bacterium]
VVKPNPQQLSLFRRPALGRPLVLEPGPDEIRICTSCQRQIIVRRRTAKGLTVTEFCDAEGRYFECSK